MKEEVFSACLKNYVKTNTYKLEDPFAYSVSMKRITWTHMISSNGETTQLWLNSKYEKPGDKPQISLRNASPESFVAEETNLTGDNKFSYQDTVKVIRGNFICFYATATETSDTSKMNELDELDIN